MAAAIGFVLAALMDSITDCFGITYTVSRSPLGAGAAAYYVHAGEVLVARAALRFFKGCIDDVLVQRQTDRRCGIASALSRPIEAELGRPLRPSRGVLGEKALRPPILEFPITAPPSGAVSLSALLLGGEKLLSLGLHRGDVSGDLVQGGFDGPQVLKLEGLEVLSVCIVGHGRGIVAAWCDTMVKTLRRPRGAVSIRSVVSTQWPLKAGVYPASPTLRR